jgi:hypothetical protein
MGTLVYDMLLVVRVSVDPVVVETLVRELLLNVFVLVCELLAVERVVVLLLEVPV